MEDLPDSPSRDGGEKRQPGPPRPPPTKPESQPQRQKNDAGSQVKGRFAGAAEDARQKAQPAQQHVNDRPTRKLRRTLRHRGWRRVVFQGTVDYSRVSPRRDRSSHAATGCPPYTTGCGAPASGRAAFPARRRPTAVRCGTSRSAVPGRCGPDRARAPNN